MRLAAGSVASSDKQSAPRSNAADAWATLDDIDQELRRILKYGSEITRDQLAETIRTQINELCQRIT